MPGLLEFLFVGIGGALGAYCRRLATVFLKAHTTGKFPLGTLIINATSCTIAGILLAVAASMNHGLYLALTMGFLGGYSTLSTMNYEAVSLILNKQYGRGVGYLAATYGGTLACAAIGYAIMSAIIG
jgi:CrcB protein